LRDLKDSALLIRKACCHHHIIGGVIVGGGGVYLGSTIQSILEFMEDVVCHHPNEDYMGGEDNSTMKDDVADTNPGCDWWFATIPIIIY